MMPPPRWNSSNGTVQWGLHQDKDITRAPWEVDDDENDDQPSYTGDVENGSVGDPTQASSAQPREEKSLEDTTRVGGHLAKKESHYWEEVSGHWSHLTRGQDNSVGYLYRFPDLLKRWDDVDGDRGTWYEVMKKRLLRVEMERRREEGRKAAQAAAEAVPQAQRPRRRRIPSIINIAGIDRAQSAADRSHPSRVGPKGASLPSCEFSPMPTSGHATTTLSPAQWLAREERKAIDAYLQDRELEVVVILEGIDTSTGNTVQARHSYCWEDIRWDRTFASCVSRAEDGICEVDFSKFHDTLEAPADCSDHGFIQSYA